MMKTEKSRGYTEHARAIIILKKILETRKIMSVTTQPVYSPLVAYVPGLLALYPSKRQKNSTSIYYRAERRRLLP